MQLGESDRLDVIAEGLPLLVENVATLSGDLESLRTAERKRGLWMLAGQADEEAAKALILLDLVRMNQQDRPGMTRQIGRFYNHLARCIYAEMAQMNPADFAEVRRMVESMRPSHYLDGPNDVDWIFRNHLLAVREERLYVDYIHEEEGNRWITPATNDDVLFGGPSPAVRDLIAAMDRLGCMSRPGLTAVAEAWQGQTIQDSTHWQEIVAINRSIVDGLFEKDLASDEATDDDACRLIDHWTFPLGELDISELKVSRAELQAEKERWAPI
jgi:hypothetical protein